MVVGADVDVVVGADVDVVRTAFFTTEVEAGTLTSSVPPPHPAATRTPTTSKPATVLMPPILPQGRDRRSGSVPDQQDSQKGLVAVLGLWVRPLGPAHKTETDLVAHRSGCPRW